MNKIEKIIDSTYEQMKRDFPPTSGHKKGQRVALSVFYHNLKYNIELGKKRKK